MPAPCKGCPCSCTGCIFDTKGAPGVSGDIVLSQQEYGCIRPDAGALVKAGDLLGMMRDGAFHPVTAAGAHFLRTSGNALAALC